MSTRLALVALVVAVGCARRSDEAPEATTSVTHEPGVASAPPAAPPAVAATPAPTPAPEPPCPLVLGDAFLLIAMEGEGAESDSLAISFDLRNEGAADIGAWEIALRFTDALGDEVVTMQFKSVQGVIAAGAEETQFFGTEDNPFIADQPYDKLFPYRLDPPNPPAVLHGTIVSCRVATTEANAPATPPAAASAAEPTPKLRIRTSGVARERAHPNAPPVMKVTEGELYEEGLSGNGWVMLKDAPVEAWVEEASIERLTSDDPRVVSGG